MWKNKIKRAQADVKKSKSCVGKAKEDLIKMYKNNYPKLKICFIPLH